MPFAQRLRRNVLGRLGSGMLRLAVRWTRGKSIDRLERKGAALGRLLMRASRKHRSRALANLAMCFPEMPGDQRTELAVRVFEHFGRITMDFLSSESRTREEVLQSLEMEGFDHFVEARRAGKGVIILAAHFGNWERFAHFSALHGFPLSVVARDADYPGLQSQVSRLRGAAGLKVLSRGNAARQILGVLRAREIVGLLADQNSGESFLPFFGQPSGTVLGPAVIHLRTGAPILPVFCARIGVGTYRAVICPPLVAAAGFESPQEAIMAAYLALLERFVREYPEQWLWFHDRWKSAREAGMLSGQARTRSNG